MPRPSRYWVQVFEMEKGRLALGTHAAAVDRNTAVFAAREAAILFGGGAALDVAVDPAGRATGVTVMCSFGEVGRDFVEDFKARFNA